MKHYDTDKAPPAAAPAAPELENDAVYPEGGLRAWLVVLGAWMALFASLGLMNIVATFQTYLSTHQLAHYDESTIGWIFSLYVFMCFGTGIYAGPLADKYGPRWLIFSGTIGLVTGLMLFSVSSEYWHFLVTFGLLCGVASSLLLTPSFTAVGHFFMVRRGFATGIASTAGSMGGVVFPLMLQQLFDSVGWAWAIRILGFICLAATIVANFLVRSRLPPARDASARPDARIFLQRAFALTTAAVFLLEFCIFIPLSYISMYALSKRFGPSFASDLLGLVNTGSLVGRLLGGFIADLMGPFNTVICSIGISMLACIGIWLPAGATTPGIIIFALLLGFCAGGDITLIPVVIGRLCKTQEYGRYYATCYTVVSIACLINIPIAGKVLADDGGNFDGLIIMTGVVYVASLGMFVAAKLAAAGLKNLWAVF